MTHSSKSEEGNSKNSTLFGSNVEASTSNEHPSKSPRIDPEKHPSRPLVVEVELEKIHLKFSPLSSNEIDVRILKRDPGEHTEMCNYPSNIHDEVRHAYLKDKPYQIRLSNYPFSREKHPHRFQASWLLNFLLGWSITKDATYCLSCYLFTMKRSRHLGCDAFTFT